MHLMRSKAGTDIPSDADHLGVLETSQEVRERRRRNEAIRRQEFAQLRALRQNGAEGAALTPAHQRDEVLQSVLGQETRTAETLQKIDAIEAQMSDQWWRQRPASADKATTTAFQGSECSVSTTAEKLPAGAAATAVSTDAAAAQMQPVEAPQPASAADTVLTPVLRSFVPHPDVEEAAILFAHGDMDGARTRLLEQLLQALNNSPVDDGKVAVLWHAALDLCRATGDEEAFESLAIDYAEHFGRSAPLWVSIPERLGLPALCGAMRPVVNKRQFQWSAASVLTVSSVAALRASKEGAQQPWHLSWTRLTEIEAAALAPLADLLQEWAGSAGQFVFSDAAKLLQVLEQHTLVSDASQRMEWWTLRMALLRLMGRMQAYEQVALDYCITYEVSPPSWVEPQCHCVVQEEGEADVSLLHDASQHTGAAQEDGAVPVVIDRSQGLAGVIEGDLQEWLDLLGQQAQPGQVLDVSCDNLIRLDFVAASCVLNWAAEMQSKGVQLRFSRLHQLMAAFLHVMGVHEHATVQATLA
mgnify:FL=1